MPPTATAPKAEKADPDLNPSMKPAAIKACESAMDEYAPLRAQHAELTKKLKDAKTKVNTTMEEHKIKKYRHPGTRLIATIKNEKVFKIQSEATEEKTGSEEGETD